MDWSVELFMHSQVHFGVYIPNYEAMSHNHQINIRVST